MGSPPIPPHERTWRHPSEVAAAEWHAIRHTEPHRSTRGFAFATGTLGLIAVGVLILTVTPGNQGSPVAISATTSPVSARESAVRSAPPAAARAVPDALATPIGDGHLALMTVSAVAATLGAELDVQLTNGPIVTAVVDATTPGVVVVSIATSSDGHEIADQPPEPNEIVTVLAEPPITVAYSAVATIDAEEGTPVVDRDGDLVGLCTQRHDGEDAIELIDVTGHRAIDEQRAVATTAAP